VSRTRRPCGTAEEPHGQRAGVCRGRFRYRNSDVGIVPHGTAPARSLPGNRQRGLSNPCLTPPRSIATCGRCRIARPGNVRGRDRVDSGFRCAQPRSHRRIPGAGPHRVRVLVRMICVQARMCRQRPLLREIVQVSGVRECPDARRAKGRVARQSCRSLQQTEPGDPSVRSGRAQQRGTQCSRDWERTRKPCNIGHMRKLNLERKSSVNPLAGMKGVRPTVR
jgi:hypothetical protein